MSKKRNMNEQDLASVKQRFPGIDWELCDRDSGQTSPKVIHAVIIPNQLDIYIEPLLSGKFLLYSTNTFGEFCSEYQSEEWAQCDDLTQTIEIGIAKLKSYHRSILDAVDSKFESKTEKQIGKYLLKIAPLEDGDYEVAAFEGEEEAYQMSADEELAYKIFDRIDDELSLEWELHYRWDYAKKNEKIVDLYTISTAESLTDWFLVAYEGNSRNASASRSYPKDEKAPYKAEVQARKDLDRIVDEKTFNEVFGEGAW